MKLSSALALLSIGALVACSGGKGSTSGGGDRTGVAPPAWYGKPPKGASKLYFVGAASGASTEVAARELAVSSALNELTVFCGATVKSEAESVEIERNGKLDQSYSLMVDVAGDEMTVKEAVVADSKVGAASDGSFDAFVLLEWPKSRYNEILAAQKDRGKRALDLYLVAEAAVKDNRLPDASEKLGEAQNVLGPMKSMVPLDHARFKNTTLLYDAMTALEAKIKAEIEKKKRLIAVTVLCDHDGKAATCDSRWVGAVKQRVSATKLKVAADAVSSNVARQILAQSSPETDAVLRNAGYVLAVRYDAKLTAKEDGFTFVHCGARGVVFDTAQNRVVSVKEVKPVKGGHVHFKGAMEKGCSKVEKDVVSWLDTSLSSL